MCLFFLYLPPFPPLYICTRTNWVHHSWSNWNCASSFYISSIRSCVSILSSNKQYLFLPITHFITFWKLYTGNTSQITQFHCNIWHILWIRIACCGLHFQLFFQHGFQNVDFCLKKKKEESRHFDMKNMNINILLTFCLKMHLNSITIILSKRQEKIRPHAIISTFEPPEFSEPSETPSQMKKSARWWKAIEKFELKFPRVLLF